MIGPIVNQATRSSAPAIVQSVSLIAPPFGAALTFVYQHDASVENSDGS